MKLKWNCFSDNFQFAKPFERGEIFLKGLFNAKSLTLCRLYCAEHDERADNGYYHADKQCILWR